MIHGLGFKDVKTAKASVKKIEGSGKTHAHKIRLCNRNGTKRQGYGKMVRSCSISCIY